MVWWVDSGALATSSAYGGEFNTDVRRNITDKVGLQLVDVSTSTGVGSGRDAGLWMTTQTGGAGYKNGIEFSAGGGALPVKSSGSLIVSGAGTVTKGIDWLSTTFTGNIIDVPRMSLDPNGQLSVTRASAGRSLILTGFTGSDQGGEIQQTNATGGSKFLREDLDAILLHHPAEGRWWRDSGRPERSGLIRRCRHRPGPRES